MNARVAKKIVKYSIFTKKGRMNPMYEVSSCSDRNYTLIRKAFIISQNINSRYANRIRRKISILKKQQEENDNKIRIIENEISEYYRQNQ